jgi:hypothetical protein
VYVSGLEEVGEAGADLKALLFLDDEASHWQKSAPLVVVVSKDDFGFARLSYYVRKTEEERIEEKRVDYTPERERQCLPPMAVEQILVGRVKRMLLEGETKSCRGVAPPIAERDMGVIQQVSFGVVRSKPEGELSFAIAASEFGHMARVADYSTVDLLG